MRGAVNFSEYSVALGRRFRALKLWFVLRYYGREGIAEMLRGHMRMAREFGGTEFAGIRISRSPRRCCFRWCVSACAAPTQQNRELLERVNATGEGFFREPFCAGSSSCAWPSATSPLPARTWRRLGI